ncbi:MAG: sulfatase-like hydrolase/transferase [Granulosicoccus sp.]
MPRHILLVVVDQFRADCVSGALADAMPLPNLQALMADAVTFTRHYTVTTPCGPSRASLLTGLYAMNHRSIRNGTPLSAGHQTIGSLLRTTGFESMLFGYTDTSVDPRSVHFNDPALCNYEGLAAGFSERVSLCLETPGAWTGYLQAQGYQAPDNYWDWYKPRLDKSTATAQNPQGSPIRSPAIYSAQHSDTAYLADRTLEVWSGLAPQDQFSLVTFIRPHPPLVAPSPYNSLVDPETLPLPTRAGSIESLQGQHALYKASFSAPSGRGLYAGFDGDVQGLSERHIAELRAVYLGLAAEVDHHIGRLLDYLRRSGTLDETLVVVTADHGELLGDHYLWGKLAPFESALHVPLIIRDPDNTHMHGQCVSAFTESVDIAPTLMEWAGGISVPAFDGHSLQPWLRGEKPGEWRSHVYAEAELGEPDTPTCYQQQNSLHASQANFAMYRDAFYKYVHFNGGVEPLLFDLQNDPDEHMSLHDDPACSAKRHELAVRLLEHRMTHAEHSLSNMKLTPDGLFTAC